MFYERARLNFNSLRTWEFEDRVVVEMLFGARAQLKYRGPSISLGWRRTALRMTNLRKRPKNGALGW